MYIEKKRWVVMGKQEKRRWGGEEKLEEYNYNSILCFLNWIEENLIITVHIQLYNFMLVLQN